MARLPTLARNVFAGQENHTAALTPPTTRIGRPDVPPDPRGGTPVPPGPPALQQIQYFARPDYGRLLRWPWHGEQTSIDSTRPEAGANPVQKDTRTKVGPQNRSNTSPRNVIAEPCRPPRTVPLGLLQGPGAPVPGGRVHIVAHGDTLWAISGHYLGDPKRWTRIYDANRVVIEDEARRRRRVNSDHGHWIYPGTRLVIP